MAYILRSLAVIGVIALNSPVHGDKSGDEGAGQTMHGLVAAVAAPVDTSRAITLTTAAREAAQIMAGLDPETRERLLALTAAAATGRATGR